MNSHDSPPLSSDDALARRYAKVSPDAAPGQFRLRIEGLRGSDDYLHLAGYLDGLPVVRRVVPVSASQDALELDVDLASGLANFSRYVGRAGVLVPAPATGDGSAGAPAVFLLGGK